jgi:hypothetical protein
MRWSNDGRSRRFHRWPLRGLRWRSLDGLRGRALANRFDRRLCRTLDWTLGPALEVELAGLGRRCLDHRGGRFADNGLHANRGDAAARFRLRRIARLAAATAAAPPGPPAGTLGTLAFRPAGRFRQCSFACRSRLRALRSRHRRSFGLWRRGALLAIGSALPLTGWRSRLGSPATLIATFAALLAACLLASVRPAFGVAPFRAPLAITTISALFVASAVGPPGIPSIVPRAATLVALP